MPIAQKNWFFGLSCIIGFVILFAAYSNFFHNSFHFDDFHVISGNLYIRDLNNIPKFFTNSETHSYLPSHAVYRPLIPLTLAFDYARAGSMDPFQFRITQFVLLVLLSVLLYYFYYFLMNQVRSHWSNCYLALLATLLFAAHPTTTETMNIIAVRSELLAVMGILGSFNLYLYFPRCRRYYFYLFPMMVGALAKAPAVMFAPLLLVYSFLFEESADAMEISSNGFWKPLTRSLRVALPAFIVGIFLLAFIQYMNGPYHQYAHTDPLSYLRSQPFVWLHYIRLFFLPIGLTADTDMRLLDHWYDLRFIAGVVGILLLIVMMLLLARRRIFRPAAFGIAWFILALLPASSIIPLAEVANEHRIFFPYIGLMLAVVWGVGSVIYIWQRRRPVHSLKIGALAFSVAMVVAISYAWGTYERNKVWYSGETLWYDVSQKSPRNGRALMNYGLSQMNKGRFAVAQKYYERAKQFSPAYSPLEVNLAIVYGRLGQADKAESHYQRAIELRPYYPEAYYYYAKWLIDQKRSEEALALLKKALTYSASAPNIHYLLMELFAALGNEEALQKQAETVLAINAADRIALSYKSGFKAADLEDKSFSAQYNDGLKYLKSKDYLAAAGAFRQALEYNPHSIAGWNNLGWSLEQLGFYQQAVQAYRTGLAEDPNDVRVQNNLKRLLRNKRKAS